jgi:uncharacterized repeat protein (TIGR01451 family)
MRHSLQSFSVFVCLTLLLAIPLTAQPAQAGVQPGGNFGNAVACMQTNDMFATTTNADTIHSRAPAGNPAVTSFTTATRSTLINLGATGAPHINITNGIGTTYGLAYDDGALSGERRLFISAYAKRLGSFGPGGSGGIYVYSFARNHWELAASVPGTGSIGRIPSDSTDRAAIAQIGRVGLGDIEIAPDGRTLYVMNLGARRIERFNLTTNPITRMSPLSIPFTAISNSAAVRADLVPFALEFYPDTYLDYGGPLLIVGVTDTAARGRPQRDRPTVWPAVHVLGYFTGSATWTSTPIVSQGLGIDTLAGRHNGSTLTDFWESTYPNRDIRGWNPWSDDLNWMPTRVNGNTRTLIFPQPLLSDIEFDRTGHYMYLGLRDRTGDQAFGHNPPPGEKQVIAQGDTLVFHLAHDAWHFQQTSRRDPVLESDPSRTILAARHDYFNDNVHAFNPYDPAPAHIENHIGALASALQGNPSNWNDRLAMTTLLGNSRSGIGFYTATSSQRNGYLQMLSAADNGGGKATALGDVEWLCTYALIGGRVWQDNNANGVQDAYEPAFAGLTLEIFQGSDPRAPALARAVSNAQGEYVFAVPANTAFNLRIAATDFQPGGRGAGWRFTTANQGRFDHLDSDASPIYGYMEFAGHEHAPIGGITGSAIPTRMIENDRRDFDIGLTRAAASGRIGDLVWSDTNRNGLQDSGEAGVAQIYVTLERGAGSAAPVYGTYPRTTVTDANGHYRFTGLEPGLYTVRFTVPPTQNATRIYAGDSNRDSDADASTGYRTRVIPIDAIAPNQIDSIDFGLIGGQIDLEISKTGPVQALVGTRYSYTLTYRNLGNGYADNVYVVDRLPGQLSYISAAPTPIYRSGTDVVWSLGRLAPGQVGSIVITVAAPATMTERQQDLTNDSLIGSSTMTEAQNANNRSMQTTTIVRPEITISKSAPAQHLIGSSFSYVLTYSNQGSAAAADVTIDDPLPAAVAFEHFTHNPGNHCRYDGSLHTVRCNIAELPSNAAGYVSFIVNSTVDAGDSLHNTARIETSTPGDDPTDNTAASTTTTLRPDPGIELEIVPAALPIGVRSDIRVHYANGLIGAASGSANESRIQLVLPDESFTLGALPAGCSFNPTTATITCELGDLAPGADGNLTIPITLNTDYLPDHFAVSATIETTTPERISDQNDNHAEALADVIRPNVWIDAGAPDRIVGQGSVFWYTIDYGNTYRRNPRLTRAAEAVRIEAILPDAVTFVDADRPPDDQDGRTLEWELGTLAANASGTIIVVVQTSVPAGTDLPFHVAISTVTSGDDPADNQDDVHTAVVQPPDEIPNGSGDLQLALHSELDPLSQDGNPTNAVHLAATTRLAWPAGEVLDFSPQIQTLSYLDAALPFPYEYRARVIGWSLAELTIDEATMLPTGADTRGIRGCRPGAVTRGTPRLLQGCAYGYLGGTSLSAINDPDPIGESEMLSQAHIYWTQPPPPPMRSDVYLYTVETSAAVEVKIEVELEVWIVNAYPGDIGGIPLPEIPVVPLPDPARRLIDQRFTITLLAPHDLVGPGSSDHP